jgi:hypothetical protein
MEHRRVQTSSKPLGQVSIVKVRMRRIERSNKTLVALGMQSHHRSQPRDVADHEQLPASWRWCDRSRRSSHAQHIAFSKIIQKSLRNAMWISFDQQLEAAILNISNRVPTPGAGGAGSFPRNPECQHVADSELSRTRAPQVVDVTWQPSSGQDRCGERQQLCADPLTDLLPEAGDHRASLRSSVHNGSTS